MGKVEDGEGEEGRKGGGEGQCSSLSIMLFEEQV